MQFQRDLYGVDFLPTHRRGGVLRRFWYGFLHGPSGFLPTHRRGGLVRRVWYGFLHGPSGFGDFFLRPAGRLGGLFGDALRAGLGELLLRREREEAVFFDDLREDLPLLLRPRRESAYNELGPYDVRELFFGEDRRCFGDFRFGGLFLFLSAHSANHRPPDHLISAGSFFFDDLLDDLRDIAFERKPLSFLAAHSANLRSTVDGSTDHSANLRSTDLLIEDLRFEDLLFEDLRNEDLRILLRRFGEAFRDPDLRFDDIFRFGEAFRECAAAPSFFRTTSGANSFRVAGPMREAMSFLYMSRHSKDFTFEFLWRGASSSVNHAGRGYSCSWSCVLLHSLRRGSSNESSSMSMSVPVL